MANPDLGSIAQLVPQVSYEIVGRITPGIVVLLSLVVVAMGPSQAMLYLDETVIHPDSALSGWAGVLMVIAAYTLAFVLDGVWQIPACVRRWCKKPCQLEALLTSLKFNVVNQRLPKAGAWLLKLYAETNATQVLIVGWVVSAIINVYYLVTNFSVERLCLEGGLIAGAIGMTAVRNSIATTRENNLENLWVLSHDRTFVEQAENSAEEGKNDRSL